MKIVQGNWTMDVNPDLYSSALIKLVYECLDQVSGSRAFCGIETLEWAVLKVLMVHSDVFL